MVKEWTKEKAIWVAVWMRGHRMGAIVVMGLLLAVVPSTYFLHEHFKDCADKKFQVSYKQSLGNCYCDGILSTTKLKKLFSTPFELGFQHETSSGAMMVGTNTTASLRAWAAAEGVAIPAFTLSNNPNLRFDVRRAFVTVPVSFWDVMATSTRIVELDYDAMPFMVKYIYGYDDSLDVDMSGLGVSQTAALFNYNSMTTDSAYLCPHLSSSADAASGKASADSYTGPCREWVYPSTTVLTYNTSQGVFLSTHHEVSATPAEWEVLLEFHKQLRRSFIHEMNATFSTSDVTYCTPSYCLKSDCLQFEFTKVLFIIATAISSCFGFAQLIYALFEERLAPLVKDHPDIAFKSNSDDQEMSVFSSTSAV